MLLHDFIRFHARENADIDFAIQGARKLSYREADALTDQIAQALIGEGLAKGDRFAFLSKNNIEYALMFYAASKAGVVPVPLNYRLAPPEWAYIINDAGAKLVICSAEYVEGINSVRNDLKTVQKFIAIDAPDGQGFDDYTKWHTAQPTNPPDREIGEADDLYQMYTSGTTGHPKGAVLTQGAVCAQIVQFQFGIVRAVAERTQIVAPMYHAAAAGTAIGTIATGGTLYIHGDFNPVEVVAALSEQNIAHTTLVPAMIQACLFMVPDVKERKYDSLRTMTYGASPIAENVLRLALEVFKCDFIQGYGMTETTAVLCFLMPEDHRRALSGNPELLLSAGRPVMGTQVKIVDEDDNEVPRGTIGEICGQGPQLMSGYWNLPEASEKALWRGWMHTGDAGTMDENGYVYVQDRVKDMIISGGENVYPREVENLLFEHPAIVDAAVIGVPSDQWGEAVKGIVVLKQGHEATAEEIMEFCKGKIAGYKRPQSIDFIAELPRNASGKVLKKDLRAKFWEGKTRQVS
jgi:acyl-CoA synthetase (AMP-forming)/AMP-acid ligase II